MITPGDDYPLHQTPRPVRDPGTDPNAYDRFFFNGYDRGATTYFACALGLYPGRNVMDGAFAVVLDGIQHNVIASRILGADRLDTQVGPVRVDILEPLRRLRIVVDDHDASGVAAELVFTARGPAFEEDPYRWGPGLRPTFEYTRMTQSGTWTGTITAGGALRVWTEQRRGHRLGLSPACSASRPPRRRVLCLSAALRRRPRARGQPDRGRLRRRTLFAASRPKRSRRNLPSALTGPKSST